MRARAGRRLFDDGGEGPEDGEDPVEVDVAEDDRERPALHRLDERVALLEQDRVAVRADDGQASADRDDRVGPHRDRQRVGREHVAAVLLERGERRGRPGRAASTIRWTSAG